MTLTKEEILAEISWFNEQLAYLRNTFAAWLKEEGHEIDISEEKIRNTEGLSGQYDTFKYTFVVDKTMKFCIIPYGIWIIAARGRIDISGPSGSEKLIYHYKGGPSSTVEIKSVGRCEKLTRKQFDNIDEEGWYWYDDSTIRKMIKLSKETLVYLMGRLQ